MNGAVVECQPPEIDLLANAPIEHVRVVVPRPDLGDLVPEFNNDASLYGKTLCVALLLEGEEVANEEWREHIYTPEENSQRHAIQQRKWRIARGEETADDRRLEYLKERTRRMAERFDKDPDDYTDF